MGIANECMVVNMAIGLWTGQRLDKTASAKVTSDAHAASDAARVNKHLIDKAALAPISTAASALRSLFYERTLPWKDNGDRLLTRMMYQEFMQAFGAHKAALDAAVETFLRDAYPSAVEQARFRMGTLFHADDYPDAATLRRKFYVELTIDPVATAGDFRVTMDDADRARIQQEIEAQLQTRIGKAMTDVWTRLGETLLHFQRKMADPQAVFRDSTVVNLQEIVDLLPGLNVLNDPQLDQIAQDITASLIGLSPTLLRKDPAQRAYAATEAERIMEQMAGFMGATSV